MQGITCSAIMIGDLIELPLAYGTAEQGTYA